MPSVVITPSPVAALTIEQVRRQCRVDGTDEDDYFTEELIPAVSSLFESETRCRLLNTVVEDVLPCWPNTGRIDLRWGVPGGVSSISYLDRTGQAQPLSPSLYQVAPGERQCSIFLSPGALVPSMLAHPQALRVRYTAGFGAGPEDVPRNVRLWLLLHLSHFWVNREASGGVDLKPLLYADSLISDYRCISI